MAGISGKAVRNRIRSMTATRQITRAMEMVASSKLRRAQSQLLSSRPYAQLLTDTVDRLLAGSRGIRSPYLDRQTGDRALYLVIAGDRGLAGGYNSRVLRLAEDAMAGKTAQVLPLGKRAADHFRARRVPRFSRRDIPAAEPGPEECFALAQQICAAFLAGELDQVYLVCTRMDSVLTQTPLVRQLLPLEGTGQLPPSSGDTLWEPSPEEVLEAAVPACLGGILYGALCESRAAEAAARRAAMNTATANADEMIAQLRLTWNRARQAAITQEITEIVAGS